MVFFNHSTMQMVAKIVYYGPGLAGKTANLQWIFDHTSSDSHGEMVSLATETDRTLFFDLLPIDAGSIAGYTTRIQLYTVPGQVFYNSTRKLVLKAVDGVVFVADSQRSMLEANIESLENLKTNLAETNQSFDDLPIIFQYNKRDLPDICSVGELDLALNPHGWPSFETTAINGQGVFETLKTISKNTIVALMKQLTPSSRATPDRSPALPMPASPKAPDLPEPPEKATPDAVAEDPPKISSSTTDLHISAVTPAVVRPAAWFVVEVVFHIEGYEVGAGEGQRVDSVLALQNDARLSVRLVPIEQEKFDVDQEELECRWRPPHRRVEFLVHANQELDAATYPFRVEVWCEGVQLTRIYCRIAVSSGVEAQVHSRPIVTRSLPRSIFASYSRSDRVRVAERLAALMSVGIEVFMDCLDMKPAENWKAVLEREILVRDAVLLFWSTAASKSEWVEREWHFALTRRGRDHIIPNALESPRICPPPSELADLQFGSVLTELTQAWRRKDGSEA